MNAFRESPEPDLTDLLKILDEHLGQIGRTYGDWMDFSRKSMPPEIDSAVDDITEQYDKLVANVYYLWEQIGKIKDD
jgi:hypothetical protein